MTYAIDDLLARVRMTAGHLAPVLLTPTEAVALVAEVERLRTVESDAERVRVEAELWNYYEAFVVANGADSITDLVCQRDAACEEAHKMRLWAEEAARAENLNAEDAKKERAAVVAWLRGEPERLVACDGHRHADGKPCFVLSPMPADELADAIERGEHRREEEG